MQEVTGALLLFCQQNQSNLRLKVSSVSGHRLVSNL